ncbi:unnamed protein product, partial [Porites evermanni]
VNRSACSNARQGPRKQYNAFKDFHDSETTAHILAAWMQFTGMNDIEGFRKLFYYYNGVKEKKQPWLFGEIKTFLEQYVFQHTSDKLQALSVDVSQLDELDRNGYLCRQCGQRFN